MQACFQVDPEMALRNEDKDWIRTEIQSAVALLKPHGWRKASTLLRELGPIATIIAVVVTLGGITLGALYQSFSHVKDETEFRTHTNDTLKELQDGIKDIRNQLAGMTLKQISENPVTPKTITEAKNILVEAASKKIQIDKNLIKDAGVKFVEATQKDPAAWNTTLAFLNYKSFLDSLSASVPSPTGAKAFTTRYHVEPAPGYKLPEFRTLGTAPKNESVEFNFIETDENIGQSVGDRYLFGDGGGIDIDGMQLRNVIFSNVHIVYRGGNLKLQNVYFRNCTFEIVPGVHGQDFATTFLQTGPATIFAAG